MIDAATLTRALGGRWYGSYGLAFCPAHRNTRTPALSLADGERARLLLRCHAGCTFREITGALRERGLLEWQSVIASAGSAHTRRQAGEKADEMRRSAQARQVWQEAVPIHGTLAESYLRARGITCELPATLRFHPECWHRSACRLPALLALVEGADDFAVHRAYLSWEGRKADVEPAKAMLGPCAGGAVCLSDAPGFLVVTEGIETGLSLLCGLLPGPATVWAALSTSGMKTLQLPARPERLAIAADGDAPGKAAAHALAERASGLGWHVSLLPAPEGRDWNDIVRQRVTA